MLSESPPAGANLFRILGDPDRLRLLALCAADELSVGELATLLGESQPQITRKSQPLRDAGLLHARRDGTRTLLRTTASDDPVARAAFETGRTLCLGDGSLARVSALVMEREATSRRLFAEPKADAVPTAWVESPRIPSQLSFLSLLGPLLPGHALAIDLGTGEGALLPLLSPLYDRVIAVDRSAARLARCAEQVAALGLPNVRLREGDADDLALFQEAGRQGGADLVVLSRVLHHAARPQDVVSGAARLVRAGGHLVICDHVPHDDERLREEGHVWLGFATDKLRGFLRTAALDPIAAGPLPIAAGPLPIAAGRLPGPATPALQFVIGRRAPAR